MEARGFSIFPSVSFTGRQSITMILFGFFIAISASIIGGICGIGGGVLIKPLLDITGIADPSQASFLSAVTVLTMTGYYTGKNLLTSRKVDNPIDYRVTVPLAVGASLGGVAGKVLFELIKSRNSSPNIVGVVQSIVLGVLVIGTLIYTLRKSKIKSLKIEKRSISLIIGLALGLLSSFLGIGGGPFNIAVLFFFFSMETKDAVQNSLFIILFSQISSLTYMIVGGKIPEVDMRMLLFMAAGGVVGGVIGKRIGKQINSKTTDKLFIGLMVVIVGICTYNSIDRILN